MNLFEFLFGHVHIADPDALNWAPDHSCKAGFTTCTKCGELTFLQFIPGVEGSLTGMGKKWGKWRLKVAIAGS